MPLEAHLMSSSMGIGELGAQAGVNASTVRYYEAEGLLPRAARRSGRRVYGLADLQRLKMIVLARSLGFRISDLRKMVRLDGAELKSEAHRRSTELRRRVLELAALAEQLDRLSHCECEAPLMCSMDSI